MSKKEVVSNRVLKVNEVKQRAVSYNNESQHQIQKCPIIQENEIKNDQRNFILTTTRFTKESALREMSHKNIKHKRLTMIIDIVRRMTVVV